MNNSLGTDSHDLVVLEPGRPDGPGVIELVATTDHSVTLQWRPGFDGGYNQSFVVSEIHHFFLWSLYRGYEFSSSSSLLISLYSTFVAH